MLAVFFGCAVAEQARLVASKIVADPTLPLAAGVELTVQYTIYNVGTGLVCRVEALGFCGCCWMLDGCWMELETTWPPNLP